MPSLLHITRFASSNSTLLFGSADTVCITIALSWSVVTRLFNSIFVDTDEANNLIKQNREVYNTIASYFSDTRAYLWEELKALSVYTKPGDTIVDLGCGNGRLYQMFENLQGTDATSGAPISYIGIDQSEELIKIAKEKIPNGIFYVAELTSLPLADASCDAVYCIAAFHHLPNRELRLQAVSEMKRILKKGGHIVMTNWNLHSRSVAKNIEKGKWRVQDGNDYIIPWFSPEGKILGERYYYGFTLQELFELFQEADLEIIDQYFVRKGEKTDVEEGNNIVSIVSLV